MGLITTKIHKLHIFQVTNRTFLYISRVVQLLAEILNVGPVFFFLCMLVHFGFTVEGLLLVWRRFCSFSQVLTHDETTQRRREKR